MYGGIPRDYPMVKYELSTVEDFFKFYKYRMGTLDQCISTALFRLNVARNCPLIRYKLSLEHVDEQNDQKNS